MSSDFSIEATLSLSRVAPITLSIISYSRTTVAPSISPLFSTWSAPTTLPPAHSRTNAVTLFAAASIRLGSTCLSNLKEASVDRPCLFADFLIDTGLKNADSIKTLVVESLTPCSALPKTPAIHIASFEFAITRSAGSNSLSSSSSVVIFSPFLASLTITSSPVILS